MHEIPKFFLSTENQKQPPLPALTADQGGVTNHYSCRASMMRGAAVSTLLHGRWRCSFKGVPHSSISSSSSSSSRRRRRRKALMNTL